MRKLFITLIAVLLGAAWSVAPAVAADPADKTDKADSKTEGAKEKVKEKTESAVDKVKEKARETKEKISRGGKAGEPTATDVRAAQQALKDKGQDPGPIDGRMGPRTQAALKQFQQAEGLQATGTLDETTKDKLGLRGGSALPRTDTGVAPPGDAPKPGKSQAE